jgi:hypothetical protein
MVEILKLIPQISVAAVALLSLFTVGYFSKIGIHLLGVIDVTNLVYSFGLAFGFVAFVVAVVNADSAKLLRKAAEDNFFLPFLVWLWRWIMLPLLIVGYF